MPISDLPNELIIIIGTYLEGHDLYHLILVNRRFSALFLSLLRCLTLRPEHAQAALHWAVLSGDRALAKYVLEKGEINMEVTAECNGFWSRVYRFRHHVPTEGVSREINEKALDFAMRQNATLHIGNRPKRYEFQSGYTAIEWAITKARHALLKFALLKCNKWSTEWCFNTLSFATIDHGEYTTDFQEKSMEIILEQASHSLSEQEYQEVLKSALVMAVCRAMERTVRFLLQKGVDPNAQCPWEKVPALVYARRSSLTMASARVAGMLLDYGANVDVLEEGKPLIVAFGIGCHSVRIVELLKQNKRKLCLNEDPTKPRGTGWGMELIKFLVNISRSMV